MNGRFQASALQEQNLGDSDWKSSPTRGENIKHLKPPPRILILNRFPIEYGTTIPYNMKHHHRLFVRLPPKFHCLKTKFSHTASFSVPIGSLWMEKLHKQWHNLNCLFVLGGVHPLNSNKHKLSHYITNPNNALRGNPPNLPYFCIVWFKIGNPMTMIPVQTVLLPLFILCCFLDSTFTKFFSQKPPFKPQKIDRLTGNTQLRM